MRLGRIGLLLGFTLLSASPGYAQDPTFEWVANTGAPTTFCGGYGIAHDDVGNVYVTGRFTGTIDVDPGAGVTNLTSAGAQDTYITKVDAAGNLVWAKRVGGPNDVYSFDVAVDEGGNVYVTGAFSGTADFDPGPSTFNLSSIGLFFDEIFVLKLDVNGDLVWARKMGSSDFDFGRSIAVSAAGNVFTTGSFRGTVDFDPGPGTSLLTSTSGGNDIFISKLNSSGNFVWAKQMGGSGNDIGYAITLDAAENVYTTGSFSTTADFDPGPSVFNLTEVSNGDIFISKLDGAGNFVWAKGMGGTSSDVGYGIQVDNAGNVYTTGYFHNTVDFDPGAGTANLISVGFNDAFIAKFDANGNFIWAKGMGGTSDEESSGLTLDGYGNVYATGGFESTVDFDPGPGTFNLTPAGSGGGFVVKLDEAGDFVWAQAFEGLGRTTPEGIDVDVHGSIYTTGRFNGTVDFDTGPGVSNVTAAGSNDTFIHKMSQAPPPPTITSFTPTSGPIGTTVTITGTNFSTTISNNIVFFGATRATVTAATATQLTVTVPSGSTYQPISILVDGLTAFSSKPFNVTLCSVPGINSGSFATPINFDTGPSSGPVSISVGDLDGDGKADLAIANRFANTISVLRNTSSAAGNISYAPKIDFATGFEPVSITFGDLDGDGKGDLAVAIFGEFTVSVYRNTSSGPDNISFAPKTDFLTGPPGAGPFSVAIGDLDKDGKTDLAIANYSSDRASVLRNISTGVGTINFAAVVDFNTGFGSGPYTISIGDIDLDGKLDLATSNANGNTVSVFRNTSSGVGNISYATKVDFSTGSIPRSVSMGDFDRDDKLDLAVTGQTPKIVSLFRNTSNAGSISFAARQDFGTDSSPWLVAIGDLDGDGKPDLATANEGGVNVSVLHNTSSGVGNINFSAKVDFSGGGGLVAVSLGDFDNDGKSEMVAAEFNGDIVSVFRNTIATAAPTITSFSPTAGNVGTVVTINGTNFDTTPANNIVNFNGTIAVVTAGTATSLTTAVPPGATTGKISVAGGCGTIASADDFTVSSTTNQPPVIAATTTAVPIEGIITLDLQPLISDPDDNLDPNSLYLVNSVSAEGASASLDNGFILTLDYGGVQFFGTDRISIGVCDLEGACVEQELTVEVGGDIVVYNAVSPDGNGLNDKFVLQYIDVLPDAVRNRVTLFNRWGDVVFDIENYNNDDRVFKGLGNNGKELPSGTYYYEIEFSGGRKTKTGYLSLKR